MGVNHLFDLPVDLLTTIFKLLSLKDLSNLMLTCRQMKDFLTQNDSIWNYITRNELLIEDRKDDHYEDIWKYHSARISHNWRYGIYHAKQLVKFRKKYMPWIRYCPEVLLVSVGSELRCYRVNQHGNPKCHRPLWKLNVPKLKTGDIRTNDISRFVYKDTLIACGYRDGTANLYKVDNERNEPRLVQHLTKCHDNGIVEVSCVDVICNQNQSFMVTGSDRSEQIAFWKWPRDDGSFESVRHNPVRRYKEVTLIGYFGARSMALNEQGDKIAIGPEGSDKPIFFDVTTMTVIPHRSPRMRREVVRDITWHDHNTVAYVSHGSTMALMDVRTQEMIYEQKDPFCTPLYCVKTDGNNALVVGSSQYARCVLFDRRTTNHVQMYFTQKERSPVYGLDFNHLKLVAAIDRSVGIVDFDTCLDGAKSRDYSAYVFLSDYRS